MIKLKVYLYNSDNENNGYRGQDFSAYCLQGQDNVQDITQEVDTTEITLLGISRKEQFTPSTKFIIDITEDDAIVETLHRIVTYDLVTQPILTDETYFKHEISLAEPSVDFQHRIVDNIAVTYKLKNVTLETLPAFNLDMAAVFSAKSGYFSPTKNFAISLLDTFQEYIYRGKYFRYEFAPYFETLSSDKYYINENEFGANTKVILPKLRIYSGIISTRLFQYIGDASYDYKVTEYNIDGTFSQIVAAGTILSNSNFALYENASSVIHDTFYPLEDRNKTCLFETIVEESGFLSYRTYNAIKQYSQVGVANPVYETASFSVSPNKKYVIKLSLHSFDNDISFGQVYQKWDENPVQYEYYDNVVGYGTVNHYIEQLNPNTYNVEISYFVYTDGGIKQVLTSANPYSALMFIEKAVMNSGDYKKIPNVATGDLNYVDENGVYAYNAPVYVDPNFIEELSQTTVIENFYHQKNLWEIFLEVGYYIHAIPEMKFGANDKYMLTFNRLGETKETEGISTPVAITNFRGIDDYISETDSYITNLIQLGGYRDEWIAPKSQDEKYLVCNENAALIVSSPIIELLGLQIRANKAYNVSSLHISEGDTTMLKGDVEYNEKQDATNYVFEENIYKILDVAPLVVPNMGPNRGISLYYKLGTNVITGCTYRLPTKNSGDYYNDYTLKKIIYCAFTGSYPNNLIDHHGNQYWSLIKVNDFSFRVIYRTKSDVRQSHARPDLRKYLLNSKFDNVPIHRQFNNQEDVLVDSEKFGSNIYGTLIRTGNTNYRKQEWVSSPQELKHKGEICRINDEIYYVAKVQSTYYTDHIESVVDYSKDYNQLSKIIGIPSEPRFYEISEQSLIEREKSISDYLYITTSEDVLPPDGSSYLKDVTHLSKLILGGTEKTDFSRYGILVFKGDADNGERASTFGAPDLYKEVIFPLNAYSSKGTLTYEMDCVDNFSAGDKVIEPDANNQYTNPDTIKAADGAYKSLRGVQYTDEYGKATLLDFYILETLPDFTTEEIQNLPESPIATKFTARLFAIITTMPSEENPINITLNDGTILQGIEAFDNNTLNAIFSGLKGRDATTYDNLLIHFEVSGGLNGFYVYDCIGYDTAPTWNTTPRRYIWGISKTINDETHTIVSASNVNLFEMGNGDGGYNGFGECLIKDCRESIKIDYNLKAITSSDTFIYSQYLYQPKELFIGRQTPLSIVLLSEEMNKLSNGTFNPNYVINATEYPVSVGYTTRAVWGVGGYWWLTDNFYINFYGISQSISDSDFAKVKSIVLAYNYMPQGGVDGHGLQSNRFVIARNIPSGFTKEQAFDNWIFAPYSSEIFTNKQ